MSNTWADGRSDAFTEQKRNRRPLGPGRSGLPPIRVSALARAFSIAGAPDTAVDIHYMVVLDFLDGHVAGACAQLHQIAGVLAVTCSDVYLLLTREVGMDRASYVDWLAATLSEHLSRNGRRNSRK